MGWSSDPYHFSLEDLKELPVGERKVQGKGCAAPFHTDFEGSRWAGFGFPGNEEFEWGGRGDGCQYCSWGRGKECGGCCDSIDGGGRPTVKRRAFLADTTKCCLENAKLGPNTVYLIDGKTCAPDSRNPASDICQLPYRTSCADANIVNNASCKALVSSNKTLHRELMLKYCNKNLTTANNVECANYCRDTNVGITGISSDCKKLALSRNCKKYGIPETDISCTETNVRELETNCSKLGIIVSNLGSTNLVSCNEKTVKDTIQDCIDMKIPTFECTPAKVDAENALRILKDGVDDEKDIGAANANNGQQKREIVGAAICGILGADAGCPTPAPAQKDTTPAPETPEKPRDIMDMQTIMLVVGLILMILLCMFSCSSGAIAVLV